VDEKLVLLGKIITAPKARLTIEQLGTKNIICSLEILSLLLQFPPGHPNQLKTSQNANSVRRL